MDAYPALSGTEITGALRSAGLLDGTSESSISRASRTLAAGGRSAGREELSKTAAEFEAIFIRMLLGTMLPEDGGGLFGEGPSAGMVRSLFVDQVGATLAGRRDFGIADLVERSLEKDGTAAEGLREAGLPERLDLKA